MSNNNISIYRLPYPHGNENIVNLVIEGYRHELDEDDIKFIIEGLSKEIEND